MTFINDLQGSKHSLYPPLSPLMGDDGRGVEPFLRRFIQEGLNSNWDFGWELALQLGVIFFRWDQETPCIKTTDYKSQAKIMFLVVISTMPYFWSPYPNSWRPKVRHCNLYNLHPFFHPWHILSSPSQKYFLVGAKFFLYLVAGKISNFLGTFCIGEA